MADAGRVANGADNAGDAARLQKQLASEEQVGELASGGGESIAGAGSTKTLGDVGRLVNQYGGSPGEWAKVKSSSFKAGDGTRFEVHAYRNTRTGHVYEVKTKFVRRPPT